MHYLGKSLSIGKGENRVRQLAQSGLEQVPTREIEHYVAGKLLTLVSIMLYR
jgi:hypothetical protein